ncbi:MAG: hypothetical protein SGI73_01955 [Chloroflexota bacterium]|nr:hypothetical protein [Chloroflexota bacterium]
MRRMMMMVLSLILIGGMGVVVHAQDPIPTIDPLLNPPVNPPDEEQLASIPTLAAARSDLELLASISRGIDRPTGWSGSFDTNDPQFALLLRLDLELLVGATVGPDVRPDSWFGVVPSKPLAIARDVRHDLEVLADIILESTFIRPEGWLGDDPIMRCDRATQALVQVTAINGYFVQVDYSQPDYCFRAALQASVFVETVTTRPALTAQDLVVAGTGGVEAPSGFTAPFQAVGPFVVGFYDRKATRRGGVVPDGTPFNVVGRSYTPFSNMMLVEGENFRLFIDYTFTSISNDEFIALGEAAEGADLRTACTTDWCEVER